MTERLRTPRRAPMLGSLIAVAVAVAAPAASAAPVSVNLRVEGPTQTTFEAPVTTDGHALSTATSGGPQPCDGTNAGANPSPVPTPTAALDDAARLGGFSWDGDWFPSFSDFVVNRIGSDSASSSQFWGYYVNGVEAQVGGCQFALTGGEEVLFAYDSFGRTALHLTGPGSVTLGQPVSVRVTDLANGAPLADATVRGATTGADGVATLNLDQPGVYRLKAERANAVRSNAVVVCVDPAGADTCTAGDRTAPTVNVKLSDRLVSAQSRSRTVVISWQAQDAAADGSGLATYTAEAREIGGGAQASQDTPWRTLLFRSKETSVRFRGHAGRSYEFRVTAYDRAANASVPASGTLSFPVDDRNRRIWRLSKGWRGVEHAEAYGGRVVRPRKAGVTARMRFSGTSVALIGRKLPNGGRLAVIVDGKRTTLRLRGRSDLRETLWTSGALKAGSHVLRLKALGGGPVELDAVAPLP
jgi:hypothetical protein